MKIKAIIILFFIFCMFLIVGPGTTYADKIVIKYAHTSPPTATSVYHRQAVLFKELVEAYTKGKVEVKIFPAGQLGNEVEGIQGTSMGTIDMAHVASTNFYSFVPAFGVVTLPYIFRNHYEAWTVFDNPQFMEKARKAAIKLANVRILAVSTVDFRVLTNSKKPVKKISDLKGLKIRVPKNTQMLETFKAWGQPAVSMAWSEVFTGLQQKVIDGQENPYTTIRDMKFYQVQKYISNVHYMLWTGPVIFNEPQFQKFSPDIKDAIVRAAHQANVWTRIQHKNTSAKDLQYLIKEEGMEVFDLEDEDVWEKKAMSIWPKFYKDFGNEGSELVKIVCKIMGKKAPGL